MGQAEKHNISLSDARILSRQIEEAYLDTLPSTFANSNEARIGIRDAIVYREFYYSGNENIGIEVGFPCKINAGGSARAFVLGSEGAAYALEIGQSGHVYKPGVLTGEILDLNNAKVKTRGNFEFSSSFSASAGIEVFNCTLTSNGYYRTPVITYEDDYNINIGW